MGNWQLDPTTAGIDPGHPETASVEATISTASIRTNNGIRDNDLRSSSFLEVDKFPAITFKSTSATSQINRKDFGLTLNMVLDGRLVVSEEIQITIEGEIVEQAEQRAEQPQGAE
jgi:polyisoprenoid-binding protein YceI